MIKSAAIILIALAAFLSMVINMALKKEHSSLNVVIALLGAIGGIIFYGYGYSLKDGSLLVAVPHTVLAVCGMFVGRWEVGNVEDAPLFSHPVILCLFLVSHFLAFYSLANVVMMRLGASLLKRMRIWLLRKNDLDIIYGVSDETTADGIFSAAIIGIVLYHEQIGAINIIGITHIHTGGVSREMLFRSFCVSTPSLLQVKFRLLLVRFVTRFGRCRSNGMLFFPMHNQGV